MSELSARRNQALTELIIPIAAIGFTAYYIFSVRDGPFEAKFSAYFVGTALLVTSGILVVNRLWRLWRRDLSALPVFREVPTVITVKRVVLLVLTLGYLLMIDYGMGFTLSNFIFLTCGFLLLRGLQQPMLAIGIAAVLSISGYLLFIVAFDTRFPEGPIERLLSGLFG